MPIKRRIRTRRLRRRLCQSLHLSRDELRAIDRELRRRTRWRILLPLVLANMLVIGTFVWLVASRAIAIPAITSQGALLLVVTKMAVLMAVIFIYMRLVFLPMFERLTQRDLLQVVRDRGHNVCPQCGYNLTGLHSTQTTCPECGTLINEPVRT